MLALVVLSLSLVVLLGILSHVFIALRCCVGIHDDVGVCVAIDGVVVIVDVVCGECVVVFILSLLMFGVVYAVCGGCLCYVLC